MLELERLLKPEQIDLRAKIIKFVGEELAPVAQEMYLRNSDGFVSTDKNLRNLLERIAEERLHGIGIPANYGGRDLSIVERIILNEEFGYEDLSTALMFVTTGIFANAMLQFGTEQQKQEYLREIANGAVCAFLISEPNAGSDAFGQMATMLKSQNGSYLLNGAKNFGTNIVISKYSLVIARYGDKIKAVIVHLSENQDKYQVSLIKKMGLMSSSTGIIYFDDFPVPQEQILGEGIAIDGKEVVKYALNLSRLEIAAEALGAAQRYLNEVIVVVRSDKSRKVERHRIADYAVKINAARLALYRTAIGLVNGGLQPHLASVSKLYITELLVDMIDEFNSLFEGRIPYGSTVDRIRRDVRVYPVFEGTSQIQRNVIAETKLALPKG